MKYSFISINKNKLKTRFFIIFLRFSLAKDIRAIVASCKLEYFLINVQADFFNQYKKINISKITMQKLVFRKLIYKI